VLSDFLEVLLLNFRTRPENSENIPLEVCVNMKLNGKINAIRYMPVCG